MAQWRNGSRNSLKKNRLRACGFDSHLSHFSKSCAEKKGLK